MYYPGDLLKHTEEYLLGHGTYKDTDAEGHSIAIASVQGEVQKIDRLLTIPTQTRWYVPCVGDVVVGRIVGIANKRWYVDINTREEAVLMLTAINLVGNIQRRKGELDEIMMQEYFAPGDIIVAEVQSTGQKVQIHTRNEKYTKVPYGVLLKSLPSAVSKEKTQFHAFSVNKKEARLILGLNGYICAYGAPEDVQEIKHVSRAVIDLIHRREKIDESVLSRALGKGVE
ncbi:exosome complex component RRP4 [Nematocida sp. AWRm77]|nr:exosome complex component RRP4 [Nematocida sp. AWRm77]